MARTQQRRTRQLDAATTACSGLPAPPDQPRADQPAEDCDPISRRGLGHPPFLCAGRTLRQRPDGRVVAHGAAGPSRRTGHLHAQARGRTVAAASGRRAALAIQVGSRFICRAAARRRIVRRANGRGEFRLRRPSPRCVAGRRTSGCEAAADRCRCGERHRRGNGGVGCGFQSAGYAGGNRAFRAARARLGWKSPASQRRVARRHARSACTAGEPSRSDACVLRPRGTGAARSAPDRS